MRRTKVTMVKVTPVTARVEARRDRGTGPRPEAFVHVAAARHRRIPLLVLETLLTDDDRLRRALTALW